MPETAAPPRKKILYIDLDNTLVDFPSGIARLSPADAEEYRGHYDDAPGIFALMDPLPGALAAYRELAGHFDTYILSTAPWHNPSAWHDKVEWVPHPRAEHSSALESVRSQWRETEPRPLLGWAYG